MYVSCQLVYAYPVIIFQMHLIHALYWKYDSILKWSISKNKIDGIPNILLMKSLDTVALNW